VNRSLRNKIITARKVSKNLKKALKMPKINRTSIISKRMRKGSMSKSL
jgi:predicted methyltransferase MtxX (methanogen marker protein 4)